MASDSAGIKMDMQRKSRKDRKFLASILFIMTLLSFSPMVALRAQQAARGRGGPPAGPVKRRPDGKPDISGYYNSPNAGGAAFNVEPGPPAVGQPATQGAITDPADKLIPYTAAAKAKREELVAHHLYDDPEAHCLPSGIPRQTYAPFGWQILQTDGYIVMIYEAFHAYRILPLDGRPHLPANVRLWEGDGRARWDGDTLVIDTTNQTGKQWFDMAGNFSTPTLHVVEKFTPVDSNTLNWEATMEDPAVYTRPWTISARITKNNTPNYQILEFACHEGEQDLIHYTQEEGNPTGTKAQKK
jgi:hypothetical protein